MVLPIGDDNSDRVTTPVVNYLLIAANVLVFVFLQGMGNNDRFTYEFSCVPDRIVTGKNEPIEGKVVQDPVTGVKVQRPTIPPTPISAYLTLLTSMFLHGGIAHIAGNMLFLWIFGDNVEDALGHVRYLVFYLVCGILASLAHVAATEAFSGAVLMPSLGASGAISGVLAGYVLLFPQKRVLVILLRIVTTVPAWVAVGMWFVFQLISGLGALGDSSQVGGVAYAAHIGGFVAGLALVKPFALGRDRLQWRRPARRIGW